MALQEISKRVEAHPVTGAETYDMLRQPDESWNWDDGYGDSGPLSLSVSEKPSDRLHQVRAAVDQAGLDVTILPGAPGGSEVERFAVETNGGERFLGTVVKRGERVPIPESGGAVRFEDVHFSGAEVVEAVRALMPK